jgi:hypothetical protein
MEGERSHWAPGQCTGHHRGLRSEQQQCWARGIRRGGEEMARGAIGCPAAAAGLLGGLAGDWLGT